MTSSSLRKQLESIAGASFVDNLDIADARLGSLLVARPGSRSEVADCLRACSDANAAVLPAGTMSWLAEAGKPRRADVVISLSRMNRVIEYAPADLIVNVEAGVTLRQLNDTVGANRQWLPLDPPGAPDVSLGAVAACASSGSLR